MAEQHPKTILGGPHGPVAVEGIAAEGWGLDPSQRERLAPGEVPLGVKLTAGFNAVIRANLDAEGMTHSGEVAVAALTMLEAYVADADEDLRRHVLTKLIERLAPAAGNEAVIDAANAVRLAIAGLPAADRPGAAHIAAEIADAALVEHDSHDRRVVFATAARPRTGEPGIQPLIIVGIPSGAWRGMRTGQSQHFDLKRAGLDVGVMLYGASDYASARKQLEAAAANLGLPLEDRTRHDFAIKPGE